MAYIWGTFAFFFSGIKVYFGTERNEGRWMKFLEHKEVKTRWKSAWKEELPNYIPRWLPNFQLSTKEFIKYEPLPELSTKLATELQFGIEGWRRIRLSTRTQCPIEYRAIVRSNRCKKIKISTRSQYLAVIQSKRLKETRIIAWALHHDVYQFEVWSNVARRLRVSDRT